MNYSYILCKFGYHNLKFYKNVIKLTVPNIIRREKMTVPLRECKRCGKLQHHLLPSMNGEQYNWKDGEKFRNAELYKMNEI